MEEFDSEIFIKRGIYIYIVLNYELLTDVWSLKMYVMCNYIRAPKQLKL
jgi:hypothetical protein